MLRADAFATLYLFHPIRKRISSREGRVPILMYHSVSDGRKEKRHPYYQTVTTPAAFASQMKFLHDHGHAVVNLDQAVASLHQPDGPAKRPVVITFDDGYRDFYVHAAPVLAKYGFSATMFLPTAHVGETHRSFNGAECMTWSEIRDLHKIGIQFGSHTVTHPHLSEMGVTDVEYEVRQSKAVIEERLGCAVTSFAYPYAFPEADRPFRQVLRSLLDESGYQCGVSTILGTADRSDDRYFMKRLPINTWDDERLFKAKLDGAYDWLHTVQYASKLMTNRH
ncbi:MAG TPA: polysaccharide deacetylase family protein [Bryobacteraceae bacterium]|nr:polysaccharide deacetylase family protein [Bryobacteraceae bacterium]